MHLLLPHSTLVQCDHGVVGGLSKGHSELVGLGVGAQVDVDLVHDAADLARDQAVVHDGEECFQSHGVATVDFSGVHLPAVVDDNGVSKGGEVHLFATDALEDTLDSPAVDAVGHVLLSQLTKHLSLTDLTVVHGYAERGKGALQIGHHGESYKGDVPRLLHVG